MKPGIHYPILSFCMLEISHLSESSVPSPSLNLSNQVHSITTLDSSPKGPQRTSLNSFHLGTYVPSRHSNACTIPCRPGMPCCCSHSCRVQVALQWLGVGQHSPTTSPATWIPEDSNHCRWKEETVRSPGPHNSLSHLFPSEGHGPCTSATVNDLSFL